MTAPRRIFHHSHHAERALTLPRPRWRGRSHLVAAVAMVPLGTWLTLSAAPGTQRLASAAFAMGCWAMFASSALFHARRWSPHTTEVLVRLDHTGIYLALAGTATAIALLGLPPDVARWTVGAVGVGAAIGIVVEWLPFPSPRGFNNAVYLTLGWGTLLTMPWLWRTAGPLAVGLVVLGGLLYSIGVVIVSFQRPDPDPEVFGYHEIWHLLVIAAVGVHGTGVAFVLR